VEVVRLVLAGVAAVSAFALAAPAQAALPGAPAVSDAGAAVQQAQQAVGQVQQPVGQQVDQAASQVGQAAPAAKPVTDAVQAANKTVAKTVDQAARKVGVAPAQHAQPPAPRPSATAPPRSGGKLPPPPPAAHKSHGGVLGAVHRHEPRAHGPIAAKPIHDFQAASAWPPAAEVGGRPVSLPPRTAPAPAAGGATALPFSSSSSGGGSFVPFLALLVLAALAVPRLMRRLDGLPAIVRPEPFLSALERPG
jgi:hypothetical protein